MPVWTRRLVFILLAIPLVLAVVAVWLAVFVGIQPVEVTWGSWHFRLYLQVAAVGMMALGTGVFLLWSRRLGRWPFGTV